MAPFRPPGPQCRFRLLSDFDIGTLCRNDSPLPGPAGRLSLWPELYTTGFLPAALGISSAITDADKAEFEIIKRMPVFDSKRRAYRSVGQYVSNRTLFFGPPLDYAAFAAESDAELANTKWVHKRHTRTLQSMIEFNHQKDAQKQQIFYRWVRKAYKKKYGDDVDVPELIRKGMSQELADKIAEVRGSIRVQKAHEEQFHAGGFNPRPIKFSHHYLLGTLSEHATGMAVDIDDTQNAQLTASEWKFIENLVGKHIVRSGRWGKEEDAEKLWNDIVAVNDLFVKKVASEVTRIEKERADKTKAEKEKEEKEKAEKEKAGLKPALPPSHKPVQAHHAKTKPVLSPLHEVLGDNFKSLSPWVTTGFFHLPLDLVLELHAHGFTWGASFSTNVDLHHFELDK